MTLTASFGWQDGTEPVMPPQSPDDHAEPVASASADVDQLPPTQYLIMETLAGRWRTGEHMWTFPNRPAITRALKVLETLGLIGVRSGPVADATQAWLTDVGRDQVVRPEYTSPLDGAAHSVWLHGKWRWLTGQMTTNEREAFFEAAKRHSLHMDIGDPIGPLGDDQAWWRDGEERR
jgi:hypothetical protein